MSGWWIRKIMNGLVRYLCHNAQHFYSTILNRSANCCGIYKLIFSFSQSQVSVEQWSLCAAVFISLYTISSITPKISHPHCCKLAEVVTLSSRPFNVNLSVCEAALLIAKLWHNWKKCPVSPSDSTRYCAVIEWADRVCWMNSGWGSQFGWIGRFWRLCQPCRLTFQTNFWCSSVQRDRVATDCCHCKLWCV